MLVTLIFSIPTLKWGPEFELDHLELFAGDCAVTRGEIQDCTHCAAMILWMGTIYVYNAMHTSLPLKGLYMT